MAGGGLLPKRAVTTDLEVVVDAKVDDLHVIGALGPGSAASNSCP